MSSFSCHQCQRTCLIFGWVQAVLPFVLQLISSMHVYMNFAWPQYVQFVELYLSQLAATESPFFLFPVDDDKFRAITSSLDNPNTMKPRLWAIHPCFCGPSIFVYVSFYIWISATGLLVSRCKWDVWTEIFLCVICICPKIAFPNCAHQRKLGRLLQGVL